MHRLRRLRPGVSRDGHLCPRGFAGKVAELHCHQRGLVLKEDVTGCPRRASLQKRAACSNTPPFLSPRGTSKLEYCVAAGRSAPHVERPCSTKLSAEMGAFSSARQSQSPPEFLDAGGAGFAAFRSWIPRPLARLVMMFSDRLATPRAAELSSRPA